MLSGLSPQEAAPGRHVGCVLGCGLGKESVVGQEGAGVGRDEGPAPASASASTSSGLTPSLELSCIGRGGQLQTPRRAERLEHLGSGFSRLHRLPGPRQVEEGAESSRSALARRSRMN